MLNKITNTCGLFYPVKQKFLSEPSIKSLGETYSEIPKEKRNFYFKHYKKLLKLKSKKKNNYKKDFATDLIESSANQKLWLLNFNLTHKKINSIKFLGNHIFYENLRQTKFKVKKLTGYSQYYDKIFR